MRKVGYLHNQQIAKYELSKEHPMKTKRIQMVHSLISNYNITDKLKIYQTRLATSQEMKQFHNPQYIKYLQTWVNPKPENIVGQYSEEDLSNQERERQKIRADIRLGSIFKINQSFDCPGFEGLYNFCQIAAGSSIDAADLIISGLADVAINWSGGFHHAKKTQASGFCYINDIVLCILQLLKVYPRVLYLDIDVHHGDGVEEAFYHTNRVMNVSFHEFGEDFFPGTGSLSSHGEGQGKYYTVNIPLKRGIDDQSYVNLFQTIMEKIMNFFVPDVLVIQCGADSLSKDKLGHFNLSIKGHGQCLRFMKGFNIPIVLLGGGGYTIDNVARCWTYQTALMCDEQIPNEIPTNDYFYNYYKTNQEPFIHIPVKQMQNHNSKQYLQNIVETITENLREAQLRPSVCFHSAPKNFLPSEENDWKQKTFENEDSMQEDMIDFRIKGKRWEFWEKM